MNNRVKFDDEKDIDIHKLVLKCRFRCFLKEMGAHVSNLLHKFSKTKTTRKVRTTKKPRKKPRNSNKQHVERDECCPVNNKSTGPGTSTISKNGSRKSNNNKKKHGANQQSKSKNGHKKEKMRRSNKPTP